MDNRRYDLEEFETRIHATIGCCTALVIGVIVVCTLILALSKGWFD